MTTRTPSKSWRKGPVAQPGTVLGIPLPSGGYGFAVATHRGASRSGPPEAVLWYCFGPRSEKATITRMELLAPERACLVAVASELEFMAGQWLPVGIIPSFHINDWPFPLVAQNVNCPSGKWRLLRCDRNLLMEDLSDYYKVPTSVANYYPDSGVGTSGWLENVLDQAITHDWTGRRPIPGLPKVPLRLWDTDLKEAATRKDTP